MLKGIQDTESYTYKGSFSNAKLAKSTSQDLQNKKTESKSSSGQKIINAEILSDYNEMREIENDLPPVSIKSVKSEIQMENSHIHKMVSDSGFNFGKRVKSDYISSNINHSRKSKTGSSSSSNSLNRINAQSDVYSKEYFIHNKYFKGHPIICLQ